MEEPSNLANSNQPVPLAVNNESLPKPKYWKKFLIRGVIVGIILFLVGAIFIAYHESQAPRSEVTGLGFGIYIVSGPFIVLSVVILFTVIGLLLDLVIHIKKK